MSDLPALAVAVRAAAEGVHGAMAATAADDSTTWSIAGRPFAVLHADRVELRLDPAVAAAALRTPDTHPSGRGADWIALAPATLDDHAVDRLDAWFAHAARVAAG